MLMSPQDIVAARSRAESAVNGFTTVKLQHARDAKRLASQLQAREKQVTALVNRISELDTKRSPDWLRDLGL